jgi:integrase
MFYNGEEVDAKVGVFQIRFYQGGKVVYKSVGNELEPAQAMLKEFATTKLRQSLGVPEPEKKEEPKALGTLLTTYIEKFAHGSADTIYAYNYVGSEFVSMLYRRGKSKSSEINEDDVIAFDRHLESLGNKKNTRATRYGYVRCFLKHAGLDPNKAISASEHKKLKLKPKLAVDTYSPDQIKAVLEVASERHRLIWTAYWNLGLRDEELAYGEWPDVDFDKSIWKVRFKSKGSYPWNLELEWKSKDSEERDIPIPAALLAELKAHRLKFPKSRFVFGTKSDRPDIKLLKALKSDWRQAGLNCGRCPKCVQKNECSKAKLKTFRATYMTTMLSHVNSRDVQLLAGHSRLETTERYLKPAGMSVLQNACNAAFAGA